MLRRLGKLYGAANMVSEVRTMAGFTIAGSFRLTHLNCQLLHFFLHKIKRENYLFKNN